MQFVQQKWERAELNMAGDFKVKMTMKEFEDLPDTEPGFNSIADRQIYGDLWTQTWSDLGVRIVSRTHVGGRIEHFLVDDFDELPNSVRENIKTPYLEEFPRGEQMLGMVTTIDEIGEQELWMLIGGLRFMAQALAKGATVAERYRGIDYENLAQRLDKFTQPLRESDEKLKLSVDTKGNEVSLAS